MISSAAVQGGTNNSDRISKGTAWLYSLFAQGALDVKKPGTGVNAQGAYFSAGGPTRASEATALQKAIWWLEGEDGFANRTQTQLMNNVYFAAAVNNFGPPPSLTDPDAVKAAIARATTDAEEGEYDVYVLNNFLTEKALEDWVTKKQFTRNARAQDFLYYYKAPPPPPPPPSVPDGGATLVLLGGAMVAIGALRRRLGA